jgi:hypothetical protein
MNLTTASIRDYSSLATDTSVVGFDSLNWSGNEPQALSNAAFLLPECARSLWADWDREP